MLIITHHDISYWHSVEIEADISFIDLNAVFFFLAAVCEYIGVSQRPEFSVQIKCNGNSLQSQSLKTNTPESQTNKKKSMTVPPSEAV